MVGVAFVIKIWGENPALRGHITFYVYVLAPKSGAEGNLKAHLKIMP